MGGHDAPRIPKFDGLPEKDFYFWSASLLAVFDGTDYRNKPEQVSDADMEFRSLEKSAQLLR